MRISRIIRSGMMFFALVLLMSCPIVMGKESFAQLERILETDDIDIRPSRFNIFISENNGIHLVYNTLTGSITRLNAPLSVLIKGTLPFPQTLR